MMKLELGPFDVHAGATAQLFAIPQIPFDLNAERPLVVIEGGDYFELVSLLVGGREQLVGEPIPCSWLVAESDWRFIARPFDVCQPWRQISIMVRNVTRDEHRFAAEVHGDRYEEPF